MSEPEFVRHCLELLAPLGAASARRMFGGWGLRLDGLFIAIIVDDRLYLKAAADARERYAAAGGEPFVYRSREREVTMGYWTAPPEALESAALMAPWARLALQAALSAHQAAIRPPRGRLRAGAQATRKAAPTTRGRPRG